MANLGWDKILLPNPVFVGDTLYSESEVLEVRESRSRPEQGIVKVRTRGLNQHGQVVRDIKRQTDRVTLNLHVAFLHDVE